jgi:hypothetical protein
MAERYWGELRPPDAGRFRLDASIRPVREHSGDDPASSGPPPARRHQPRCGQGGEGGISHHLFLSPTAGLVELPW